LRNSTTYKKNARENPREMGERDLLLTNQAPGLPFSLLKLSYQLLG